MYRRLYSTLQAASPGIPLSPRPPAQPAFLAVKLPTLSQARPQDHASVQVVSFISSMSRLPSSLRPQPYVPDFWNSARPQPAASSEPMLPKLHVVGGSATHYDGGPLHNLEQHREVGAPSAAAEQAYLARPGVGFWADFWGSMGLPRSFSARRALSEAATQAEGDKSQTRSRPLTSEERKGLYVLIGIVGGSWLVGGLVARPAHNK